MKLRERVSRSTYRAGLSVQKKRDESSGLFLSNRYFVPTEKLKERGLLWGLADVLLLTALMLGLVLLVASGFGIPLSFWVYPAVVFISALSALIFKLEWFKKYWLAGVAIPLLGFTLFLFLIQNYCYLIKLNKI